MAEFMQLDLSQPTAKGLLASFVVLLVGAVFSIHAQLAGTGSYAADERYLKCANPECDYDEVLTAQQQQDRAAEQIDKYEKEDPAGYQQWFQMISKRLYGPLTVGGKTNDELIKQNLITSWGNADLGLAFTCPQCGQNTVYSAIKCDKCGKIFFFHPTDGDKCPECGYSRNAERKKERNEAKRAKKSGSDK
jgi:predicted RNA-binding Zn-ribbon protein involved in translation (DUF1610 family)